MRDGVRQRLQEPFGLRNYQEDVPLTIKDSILLCQRLSIPYLWVDDLCIDQDQIAQPEPSTTDDRFTYMSDIYGSAYVTTVC
jgi:hypothetical protein